MALPATRLVYILSLRIGTHMFSPEALTNSCTFHFTLFASGIQGKWIMCGAIAGISNEWLILPSMENLYCFVFRREDGSVSLVIAVKGKLDLANTSILK